MLKQAEALHRYQWTDKLKWGHTARKQQILEFMARINDHFNAWYTGRDKPSEEFLTLWSSLRRDRVGEGLISRSRGPHNNPETM